MARKTARATAAGQLGYGSFLWGLGAACLVIALLPVGATLLYGNDKEFWAKFFLVFGFGLGAIYCFGEAAFVKGVFDEQRLTFSTPWTGTKNESWKDLVSITSNATCSWYLLRFKSGAKIRLSVYLGGHQSALETAVKRQPHLRRAL